MTPRPKFTNLFSSSINYFLSRFARIISVLICCLIPGFGFGITPNLTIQTTGVDSIVDVQHYNFEIELNDLNDTLKGRATVLIKFQNDVSTFHLNLEKRNKKGFGMMVSTVTGDGVKLPFTQDDDELKITSPVKKNSLHSFKITYQGIPDRGFTISKNKFGHRTFFGDNWPVNAHGWLPCNDNPSDKASVDFLVTAPDHYQVVSNGLLIKETRLSNHLKLTHWKETVELPTKIMIIGVADFAIDHPGDFNGVPIYSYVFPENKDAGFKSYGFAKEIMDFYTEKIGQYPYKKLANVQSATKFGGMENANAIFYEENSVNSKGVEELMAHEIAHQWFGDGVTEKNFNHLWLSEGFATFMTNAYLENKYGTDTLKKRLADDREAVFKFEKKAGTAVVDTSFKGDYMQLLNADTYKKGGWVLQMLRQKIGEGAFWAGIRSYYKKYNGSNANTADFRAVMEEISGQNLEQFFKQWLYTPGHPQVAIRWKYDQANATISLKITQQQETSFEFPLEIAIGDQFNIIGIRNKETEVEFPAKTRPTSINADPEIIILGEFEVKEDK